MKVMIAGGGIGGLATAIALRKRGIEAVVYERAPVLAPVGAGISLWANALAVLREFGLLEDILQHGYAMQRGNIGTFKGKVLNRGDYQSFEGALSVPPICTIHRADLHRVLQSALPEDAIVLNAPCRGYTQDETGVTVHFEGKPDVRGELLVGADGIHSAVRAQMLQDGEARYAGYTCWRGVSSYHMPVERAGEYMGRGARFGIVPIGDGKTYWFAVSNAPRHQKDEPGQRKANAMAPFVEWAFDIPKLIEGTDEAHIVRNDIEDRPPTKGWSQGRVVLLGDAIHPTTPNMGQGACMAIESALLLARCLEHYKEHSRAFEVYEQLRFPRTSNITKTSWTIGKMGQSANPLICWLRNLMFSLVPPSASRNQLLKVIGFDISQQPLP